MTNLNKQNIVDNVNYLMNLTSNKKNQYTIEDLKDKNTIQSISLILQSYKFLALSTSPVIEFSKNLKVINRTLYQLNEIYQHEN